jgi:flagellar protein FliO/FliZ
VKLFELGLEVPGSSSVRADQRATTTTLACVLMLLVACGLLAPAMAHATEEAPAAEPKAAAVKTAAATPKAADSAAAKADTAKADGAKAAAAKAPAKDSEPTSIEDEPLDKDMFASEEEGEAAATPKKDDGAAIGRMIFGMLFVLGLIYAVHWLLKKYGQGKTGVGSVGATGVIDVLATTQLGPDRALHLVRVGDEVVLVGATSQSFTHLRTLSGTGSVDAAAAAMGGADFQRHLYGALGDDATSAMGTSSYSPSTLSAMSGGTVGQQAPSAGSTFIQRFLSNLQMMTAR